MKKFIIILVEIFFLTGCNSYIELNDLAIINSLGIEYKDNSYKIYAGIVNIKEKDALEPNIEIYDAEGKSLYEIIDNLSLTLNKKIYLSHLDLLLINDTLKNNQIKEIVNFFVNNNETREDFLVAITDNVKNTLEIAKFREINDLVKNNARETSKTIYPTMYDITKSFYENTKIYFPYIKIKDTLVLNGLKELKNNSYYEIKDDDVVYLNYLLNNVDTYKYSFTCPNDSNKFLYLNILKSSTTNLKDELIIGNEIKIITNDCNYQKEEINSLFNNNLKNHLNKLTKKKITIKNTIRGTYEK